MGAPRSYARMAKRMLVDAAHPEETRVVVLAGHRLEEFDFETSTKKQIKGNIYLAKVIRVEPSLQAAFVEYGGNRHGFLAFNEIHPDYYRIPVSDRRDLQDRGFETREDEEEFHEDLDRQHDDAPGPDHDLEERSTHHEDLRTAEDLAVAEDPDEVSDAIRHLDPGAAETGHVALSAQTSRDDILYESGERHGQRDEPRVAESMGEDEDRLGETEEPSAQREEGETRTEDEDRHHGRPFEAEPAEHSMLGEDAAAVPTGNVQEIGGAGESGASPGEESGRSAAEAIET